MSRKKIIIILSIVLVTLAGAYIMLLVYNKPHIDVAKSSPKVSLVSKTLLDDFQNDENLANSKYLEQIIQVTGKISHLDIANGNGIVVLKDGNSFGSIMCHLSPEENERLVTLKEGQSITIKGICTGYLMDVILIKCILIN